MELTDDFKNGFIDALRVAADRRAQRADRPHPLLGPARRADRGRAAPASSTAPTPPASRARTIRRRRRSGRSAPPRSSTTTRPTPIYFEESTLEIAGIPVAYLPYFETADPTVKRKTGFLAPRFITSTALGYGVATPVLRQPRAELRPDAVAGLPEQPGRPRPGASSAIGSTTAPTTCASPASSRRRRAPSCPARSARATATSAARSSPRASSTSTTAGARAGTSSASPTSGSSTTTASATRASPRTTSARRSRRPT